MMMSDSGAGPVFGKTVIDQTVTSHDQRGGITAHTVQAESINIGHQRFELTEQLLDEVVAALDKSRPVSLVWVQNRRTKKMVEIIKSILVAQGFRLGGEVSWVHGPYEFEQPLRVFPAGIHMNTPNAQGSIMGGQQVIGLDAEAD